MSGSGYAQVKLGAFKLGNPPCTDSSCMSYRCEYVHEERGRKGEQKGVGEKGQ